MATAALLCASSALIPFNAYASAADDNAGHSTPAPPASPASAAPQAGPAPTPSAPTPSAPTPLAPTPSTPTPSTPALTSPVGTSSAESSSQHTVTTSHYMVLFGAGQDPDQIGYRTGCADGKSGASGLRVLFFGTQESGDKLRPPGTKISDKVPRVDHTAVERASLGWIRGFTQCGTASAVVAVATNNKADGGVAGADAGTRWANLVERIGAAAPSGRVTVGGGLDAEPLWSAPAWARGWVDAFVHSSSRALYVAGSADGCLVGAAGQCANKWTAQDLYHVVTGAGPNVYATPQIYRTDGAQALQWAGVSRLAQKAGNAPVRFVSVMTQQTACKQRPPCSGIDNSPSDALDQLTKALSEPDTPGGSKKGLTGALASTDVAWPEDLSQLTWLTTQPRSPGDPVG